MQRAAVLIMLLGAVGACTAPEEPVAVPAPAEPAIAPPAGGAELTYACQSGATVSARYPDQNSAVITYGGREAVLTVAPSGSGARYVGGEYEWLTATRDGQQQGLLSRVVAGRDAEPIEQCAAPGAEPGTVTPPAPVQPAQPPTCTLLAAAVEGGDAGAGNRVTILSLQNTGAQPCTLNGYPGVALTGADRAALAQVRAENTDGNYFRGAQSGPVVLSVQGKAFFDVAWSAVPHEDIGETTCPTATGLRITPPGGATAVNLTTSIQPCGRRIRVSPMRAVAEPDQVGG